MVRRLILGVVLLGSTGGCNNRAATRIEAPSWNPDGFADAILAKLDKNADNSLDKSELTPAPGLAAGAKAIDADKNGALSRDELVARFALYRKLRVGLTSKQIQASRGRRPLPGVKVTLVPEFFLDGVVGPAHGEAGPDGMIDLQAQDLDKAGVRVGYYRIVAESPKVKLPAQYGSAATTTLGIEISPVSDDPASDGTFQLVL